MTVDMLWWLSFSVGVLVWLGVLSWFDVRQGILPDKLTLPGWVVCSIFACAMGHPVALVGGFVWCGLLCFVALVLGGVGGGDVKLSLMTGTIVGLFSLQQVFVAVALSALVTALYGVVFCRGQASAHGPGMAVATVAVALMSLLF